jgi:hypothetical protein
VFRNKETLLKAIFEFVERSGTRLLGGDGGLGIF